MPATGVVSFKDDSELAKEYGYGLRIGWRYDQWEPFFYQVALGAVYLLNPRIAPVGTLKPRLLNRVWPSVTQRKCWRNTCRIPDVL